MSGKPDTQTLPGKEAGLFRQLIRHYETKQYKKGIKAADQILKKFPEHGESLSMKGLILNCQEHKEEAFVLARKGLTMDMKSHVCWHVYGLLYRGDRNYTEAIKCYKNALRLDKENFQIMRDLALLQIQMRDIPGYVETRQQLLQLKSNAKGHWLGFAVAHHLNGNHALAVQILEAFEQTQEGVPDNEQYEQSEMVMYKAMILREGGELEQALDLLQTHKDEIKDQLGNEETQAGILLDLGRPSQAEEIYRHMLQFNPDNYKYHQGLRRALNLLPDAAGNLSDDQREQLSQLYDGLQAQYPRSSAARRIPLDFKVGQAFRDAADEYVRKFLDNGVPSLFSDLKPLYRDQQKGEALGELFTRINESLEATGSFPPLGGEQGNEALPQAQGQAHVWTMFQLAQHYDMQGRTGDALGMLDRCIQHSPSLLELYTVQCRILKHAGDPEGAAAAADKARSMDLADRFVNCQAAKWQFRAGQIEQAERTAAMFTKDGDQANNLHDMQCMWYEIECGRAHLQRHNLGKALKMFLHVFKHFEDFQEDQFDFHTYCLRKMTLRTYVEMLRMEDEVYHHMYYSKAAWGSIQAYLLLLDQPDKDAKSAAEEEARLAGLSVDDRKKHKQKQKKEEGRRVKEEEAKAAKAKREQDAKEKENKEKGKKGPDKKEKDPDPEGKHLAATKDPLGEATKLVQQLKQYAGDRMQTHLLAFEVYIRKGRLLLSLQAVKRALKLAGPADPGVHRLVVRLCKAVQQPQAQTSNAQTQNGSGSSQVVQQVIHSQVEQLMGAQSIQQYSEAYISSHGSASLRHTAAAAEMLLLLQPEQKQRAVQLLLDSQAVSQQPGTSGQASHEDAKAVHNLLKDTFQDAEASAQWFDRCQKVFCWSQYFDGAERLQIQPVPDSNGALKDGVAHLSLNGHKR
ncbi:hypothetical protein ABBQ32_005768 [Trebouxia sp. C0010 RCD-2024]